jgi:hypothetical protein
MQLTAKQVQRIDTITNLIVKYYQDRTSTGRFDFHIVEQRENGEVYVFCSNNNDLRWFDTHHWAGFFITKGGSVRYYTGSMSPKLVLPVVPRLCKYENPYKKSKKSTQA